MNHLNCFWFWSQICRDIIFTAVLLIQRSCTVSLPYSLNIISFSVFGEGAGFHITKLTHTHRVNLVYFYVIPCIRRKQAVVFCIFCEGGQFQICIFCGDELFNSFSIVGKSTGALINPNMFDFNSFLPSLKGRYFNKRNVGWTVGHKINQEHKLLYCSRCKKIVFSKSE